MGWMGSQCPDWPSLISADGLDGIPVPQQPLVHWGCCRLRPATAAPNNTHMTTTCCPILTIPKHTRSVLPIHYCTHLTPEMCSSTNVDVLQGNLLIKVDRVQNAGAPLLQGTSAKWSAALSCQRWLCSSSACIPKFQNVMFFVKKNNLLKQPKSIY